MCHPRNNTTMIACLFILALSALSVQSQLRVAPAVCPKPACQNIKGVFVTEPYVRNPPVVPKCNEVIIKEVPKTAMPAIKMPVIPFVTELPSCPDIVFNDILTTPLGCLDPILNVYGTAAITDLPVPASSAVSRLTSPFSKLLPPGCDCRNHFLDRFAIPPPFI